jgi:hypothetical protein
VSPGRGRQATEVLTVYYSTGTNTGRSITKRINRLPVLLYRRLLPVVQLALHRKRFCWAYTKGKWSSKRAIVAYCFSETPVHDSPVVPGTYY